MHLGYILGVRAPERIGEHKAGTLIDADDEVITERKLRLNSDTWGAQFGETTLPDGTRKRGQYSQLALTANSFDPAAAATMTSATLQ